MSTESKLQANFVRKAKELGCVCFKMDGSVKGVPDVFLRTQLNTVLIEFKTPTGRGRISKHQQRLHKRLLKLGQLVLVIATQERCDDVLDSISIGLL